MLTYSSSERGSAGSPSPSSEPELVAPTTPSDLSVVSALDADLHDSLLDSFETLSLSSSTSGEVSVSDSEYEIIVMPHAPAMTEVERDQAGSAGSDPDAISAPSGRRPRRGRRRRRQRVAAVPEEAVPSTLAGAPSEGTERASSARSVTSASDARESIDSFFSEPNAFMSERANKLRLWQALCIELGLVDLEDVPTLPDLPHSPPSTPSSHDSSPSAHSSSPVSSSTSDFSDSRTPTPTPPTPNTYTSLPQSLTAARRLLKDRAHVSIVDYLAARQDPARRGGDTAGVYADLVLHSKSQLMREVRRERKYARLDDAKAEWLEPLLKDFGFKHARETREC